MRRPAYDRNHTSAGMPHPPHLRLPNACPAVRAKGTHNRATSRASVLNATFATHGHRRPALPKLRTAVPRASGQGFRRRRPGTPLASATALLPVEQISCAFPCLRRISPMGCCWRGHPSSVAMIRSCAAIHRVIAHRAAHVAHHRLARRNHAALHGIGHVDGVLLQRRDRLGVI